MFTNDSRWDRHLPAEDRGAEAIEVGVICKKGRLYPRWFVWEGRRYAVREITYRWKDRRGDDLLHYFTVTDGGNVFQIYFNSRHTHWRLEKVMPME